MMMQCLVLFVSQKGNLNHLQHQLHITNNCERTGYNMLIDHWQYSCRSRIFERGFQFQLDTPAQFELKTKKKDHQPSYSSLSNLPSHTLHYYCIISNKNTVIGAFQSDCSIKESRSDCSIRVFKLTGSVETLKLPWISHYNILAPMKSILFYYSITGFTVSSTEGLQQHVLQP